MILQTVLLFIVLSAVSGAVFADGDGHTPVEICHVLGNGNYNLITVDDDAVQAHLDHGDTYPVNGECPADEEEEEECPETTVQTDTDCPEDPGHTPVDICHALGNGNYNLITVDDDAVQAHLDHGDKYPVNGQCPPDEDDNECDVDPQIASETECPPPDDCEEVRVLTEQECPPPDDCEEEVVLSAVVEEPECPPDDDTPRGRDNSPEELQPVGGPQVTVWSLNSFTPVYWMVRDGNGTWHLVLDDNGELILTNVETRDRFNRATGEIEYGVTFSRLVLRRGASEDPNDYMAFDSITGQPVGFWMEFRDEHCQPEDFGDGAVCGVSVPINR